MEFWPSLWQKRSIASKLLGPFITFVLGGPGSGKGTQCAKIAETFGFVHLSAGELLRKEILSNSQNGAMILDIIQKGKIVPSDITVNLLRKAIGSSENRKILIDGFPRTDENRIAFERIVGIEPDLVIFFDCPEEEMVKRVLNRNQGRVDDNIDTIKKRLKIFDKLNLPVIDYYSRKGKVHKIVAVGTIEEVFEKVHPLFTSSRRNDGFSFDLHQIDPIHMRTIIHCGGIIRSICITSIITYGFPNYQKCSNPKVFSEKRFNFGNFLSFSSMNALFADIHCV